MSGKTISIRVSGLHINSSRTQDNYNEKNVNQRNPSRGVARSAC